MVMDKSFYHNQLMKLLGDQSTYRRLVSDPTDVYKTQLNSLVEWGYEINALNLKEKRYLVHSVCRILHVTENP